MIKYVDIDGYNRTLSASTYPNIIAAVQITKDSNAEYDINVMHVYKKSSNGNWITSTETNDGDNNTYRIYYF